jgi:hypothetical protein
LQTIESPTGCRVQSSKTIIGLIHPEEANVNTTLIHHPVKIILQLQEIEAIAAEGYKYSYSLLLNL